MISKIRWLYTLKDIDNKHISTIMITITMIITRTRTMIIIMITSATRINT